jgi:hypothetical protein
VKPGARRFATGARRPPAHCGAVAPILLRLRSNSDLPLLPTPDRAMNRVSCRRRFFVYHLKYRHLLQRFEIELDQRSRARDERSPRLHMIGPL